MLSPAAAAARLQVATLSTLQCYLYHPDTEQSLVSQARVSLLADRQLFRLCVVCNA